MMKLYYILVLLAAFTIQNHLQAEWIVQHLGTNIQLNGVFFTDANTGYVVGIDISNNYKGAALKTTNGGDTWTQLNVSCPGMFSVYFTDVNTGYIAAYDTILKTTDAGISWSPHPINMGFWIGAIYFYNSTIGYAAGIDFPDTNRTLLKTTNAGATWTPQTIPSAHYRPNCFFGTSTNVCYFVGGNALKTTDGGTSWNQMTTETNSDWSGVYFTSSTDGIIVGGMKKYGSIERTTDGGNSWAKVYNDTNFIHWVDFTDASTGFAVGTDGLILQTTDGGVNWTTQTSQSTQSLYAMHFPVAGVGYAVGDSGVILKYIISPGVSDKLTHRPTSFDLSQNYPNPFNPITSIEYQVPTRSHVSLRVFDVLGREVEMLVNGVEDPGYKSVSFNANGFPSGVYYYRLQAGSFTETKKLLLLR